MICLPIPARRFHADLRSDVPFGKAGLEDRLGGDCPGSDEQAHQKDTNSAKIHRCHRSFSRTTATDGPDNKEIVPSAGGCRNRPLVAVPTSEEALCSHDHADRFSSLPGTRFGPHGVDHHMDLTRPYVQATMRGLLSPKCPSSPVAAP